MRHATWRSLLLGASKSQKLNIFGFFMENYTCLPMAKKFGQALSPQNRQKPSQNDLTAPILTHRKQCWENGLLEGQMEAKLKNSTWVGNQMDRSFQKAHLELIWTLVRPPKDGPNRRGA